MKLTKNIQKFTGSVEGLVTDIANEFLQSVRGKHPRQMLNLALETLKPYIQTLGLRISKLTPEKIEVLIPGKKLQQEINQNLDEGAIITATLFAFKNLWKKNLPKGHFEIDVKKIEYEKFHKSKAPIRIRLEMPALTRESLFAELSENQKTTQEITAHVLNPELQVLAKIHINAELCLARTIHWN